MANPSFVDILSTMRRKSQLSGRPLSRQETAGAVAGYADTASARLTRSRLAQTEEDKLKESKRQADLLLAESKRKTDLQVQAAKDAEKTQQRQSVGTAAGATIGGVLGYAAVFGGAGGAVGGWYGAVLGAVIGGAAGGCLIISACDGPDSYEVRLSRIYRDYHMTLPELAGYYTIAPPVARLIKRSPRFKRLVKTQLVNRLVDYAECLFEIKPKMDHPILSKMVTKGFLDFCKIVGKYQCYRRKINYGQSILHRTR